MKIRLYILSVLFLLAGCAGRDDDALQEHAARVEQSYAYLKGHRCLPADVDLEAEAAWLEQHGGERYAGEAYYALGAYENLIGDDSTAMHHLKRAERCWQSAPDAPDALQGMTYYKEGRISENESLTEVALFHYRQALPYLLRANDSLYLSSVYREIARMTTDTAEQRSCFLQAVAYAEALSQPLQLDTRYAMLAALDPASDERYAISQQLCDSGLYRYAADLVRQALSRKDLPTAAHYLDLLARDTLTEVWSRHQYALLRARYLYVSGETAEAYDALSTLYRERLDALQEEGAARSFTIAERFDNAAERERNLRLEMSHQRLVFSLVGLVAAVLVAAGILLLVMRLRRNRRRLQQAQTEAHIASLEASVAEKQGQLRQMLLQRIVHAEKMTNIFADESDWQSFCTSFDSAYDGLLSRLQQQYPSLTTADLQVIALTAMNLDISDICLLLNQSKRTVWNRRQRIKEHMNISQESNIEDMIRHLLPIALCAVMLVFASCNKGMDDIDPDTLHRTTVLDTITPTNNPLSPGKTDPQTDTLFYSGYLDLGYDETHYPSSAVLRGIQQNPKSGNWFLSGNTYFLLDESGNTIRFDHPLLKDVPLGYRILYVAGVLQDESAPSGSLELRVDTIICTDEWF